MSEDLQALVLLANEVEHHVLMDEPDEARAAIEKARELLAAIELVLAPAKNVVQVKFST